MGKLIFSMSVSLDGYVETPDRSLDWANVDDELHSHFNDEARSIGLSLYGRRLYELMAGYWPTAESDPSATPPEREFAAIWRETPRVVFSSTLESVAWNSRLVRGDPVEEARRLKAENEFSMDVGGPTLAAALMRAGLIDEFRLYFAPVILGAGTPYFPPLERRIPVQLLDQRTFASGVVYLRYGVLPSREDRFVT
jgi:dihydrofolate reductase